MKCPCYVRGGVDDVGTGWCWGDIDQDMSFGAAAMAL